MFYCTIVGTCRVPLGMNLMPHHSYFIFNNDTLNFSKTVQVLQLLPQFK